jgi:cytochrome b561
MQQPRGYSTTQVALHWIIAALVVFQLFVHDGMEDAFESRVEGEPVGEDMGWAILHIAVGVSVLILAIVRVIIRSRRGVPPIHRDKPMPLVWLALATHFLLYGFIFLMPLTGAIAWFGMVELSGEIHGIIRLILIPVVLLHVAGALTEHFYFRNDTLARMLRPERNA